MHNTYFAAINSGRGFVSFYDELFDAKKFSRLYLIKGGPGTGKSSLMRRAAKEAERRGLTVRRYLCSSDPDSLDGIVVGENLFAMVDATAPHSRDTVLPGAVDELIDLGQFWSPSILAERKTEIAAWNEKKRAAYARAYHWLESIASVERARTELLSRCLDHDKMKQAAERCLARVTSGCGRVTPAQVDSVGMKGRVVLDTMHTDSKYAYVLAGERGGGHLFLKEIAAICQKRQIDTMQSYLPWDRCSCNGVYLSLDRIAFLSADCAGAMREEDKTINMERFWKKTELRSVRRELRAASRLKQELLTGASLAFDEARDAHFALEQIYAEAMDFSALSAWSSELIARILPES